MPERLLAKSRKYGRELSLEQHLLETDEAAIAVFKERILKNWCRFFRVEDHDRFLAHLRIASLFHDLGKANADFYAAVTGSQKKQKLRHEWLSALILHLPQMRSWLSTNEVGLDLEVITAAVLCHHQKARRGDWGKPEYAKNGDAVELFLEHPEVTYVLSQVAEIAQLQGLPELPKAWIVGDRTWNFAYEDANNTGDDFTDDIEFAPERRSLLLAVKAGVIVADSVASAMFRTGDSMEDWLERHLHREPITPKEVQKNILQPIYRKIREGSETKEFRLKSFQRKAPKLGNRALLLSGCGTGKTLFAYKWHQAMVHQYSVGRIIFLYPTRGTATEGFKDYVAWAPETDASLLTGTAAYELEELRENPTEASQGKDFTTEERLFALGFWGKRFFSATVDQFLAFLTHSYSSTCLLPVLTDAVVVIDEIHSFSLPMFKNLVSFLQNFEIPVLCMTATLPKTQQIQLVNSRYGIGLEPFSAESDQELDTLEKRDRYIIESLQVSENLSDPHIQIYQEVVDAYRHSQDYCCILWVVNNVDRCREISQELAHSFGIQALTYHSRFKLKDRKTWHEEIVKRFKYRPDREPVIAVTTQVCEMSLDLDADFLVTESAPISSMIQRFGRSNRSPKRPDSFRSRILIYDPPDRAIRPYKAHEFDIDQDSSKVRNFITEVIGEVSPWKLSEALLKYSPDDRLQKGGSNFVDGGYWAFSEPFRGEEEEFTVNAVLNDKDELETIRQLINNKQPFDQYVVPVPKRKQFILENNDRPSWLPRYLALADHQFYCSKRGYGR